MEMAEQPSIDTISNQLPSKCKTNASIEDRLIQQPAGAKLTPNGFASSYEITTPRRAQ